MLLLVVIAVIPALIFPQYKLPKVTGKYEVATVNYYLYRREPHRNLYQYGREQKGQRGILVSQGYRWNLPAGRVFPWLVRDENQQHLDLYGPGEQRLRGLLD